MALLCMLCCIGYSEAATINAVDCQNNATHPHVQSAINSASRGDTVLLPACDETTWTVALDIGKAIILKGAGASATGVNCLAENKTCIKSGLPSTSDYLIRFDIDGETPDLDCPTYATCNEIGVNNMTLNMNDVVGVSNGTGGILLTNYHATPHQKLKIHSNVFLNCTNTPNESIAAAIFPAGYFYGVIYNNVFSGPHPHIRINGGQAGAFPGHATWENETYKLGTEKAVFFEDNTFTGTETQTLLKMITSTAGAKWVIRYNDFTYNFSTYKMVIDAHGNNAGSFGAMGSETYGNKFINTTGGLFSGPDLRSGKNLVFYNKRVGTNNGAVHIKHSFYDYMPNTRTDHPCETNSEYSVRYPTSVIGYNTCASDGQPQHISQTYIWNNRKDNGTKSTSVYDHVGESIDYPPLPLALNTHWWHDNDDCNSTTNKCLVGVGCGTTLPTCADVNDCENGVGFWVPNATWDPTGASCSTIPTASLGADPARTAANSIKGTLYRRKNNQWVPFYSPYTYPHPLREGTPDALVISSFSPTAEQQCTGNNVRPSTTLTITTNRSTNVTCKWDTTSDGTPVYSELANTFTGAGTQTHTAELGSKSCGTTQTIYYACNCSDPSETTAVSSGTFDIKAGASIKSLFEWATPAAWTGGSGTPLTLGVIWQSTGNGYVTGARFYKNPNDTATTHILKLWTAAGVEMGSVTTSGETSSGWQQANFATPIAVSASTNYVVSYYSSAGYYAYNTDYFTADDYTNAPLSAAKTINGVYHGGNAFPDNVHASHYNYWADLVFEGSSPTAPTLTNRTSQYQAVSTNQKLSVLSSVPATCKWCKAEVGVCDLNTTYDDMANTFTNTGGETVNHSSNITQAASTSQTYWIHCMDSNLNKSTTSVSATITTDAKKTVSLSGGTKTLDTQGGSLTLGVIP